MRIKAARLTPRHADADFRSVAGLCEQMAESERLRQAGGPWHATRGGPDGPGEANWRELRQDGGTTFAAARKRTDARPTHHVHGDAKGEDNAQRPRQQAPLVGGHCEKFPQRTCCAIHPWKASTT
jgi:hypothetical protein